MYRKPNIENLKLELELVSRPIEKEAAGGLLAAGTIIAPLLGAGTDLLTGIGSAAAYTLDAIGTLAQKSLSGAIGVSVGTGLAAAYVAHKMKKPRATDIDVDRSNLYKETLKTKIQEIRRKQSLDEIKRQEAEQEAKQPTLRLT